jgi:hypothetical protein
MSLVLTLFPLQSRGGPYIREVPPPSLIHLFAKVCN